MKPEKSMTESVTWSVVQLGEFPAIRSQGRDGRDRLDDLLSSGKANHLTIDFSGVKAMSFSFVDEFLGKFLTTHDFAKNNLTVKLAGLNEDNRYAVTVCVERRETQVVVVSEDRLELLGDSILSDTFDQAVRLGTFKANDLAEALSLTASNANNRLKRLAARGALSKAQAAGSTRGGKEFVYEAPPKTVADEVPLTPA
jgi:hypothetical protein